MRNVAEPWRVLSEDPDERRLFGLPGAWSMLPAAPAGPRNRLRGVSRVGDDRHHWFVKAFTATQLKNRLRFALTAPRARDDAERELGVTLALRAAGFAAPRPVAYGRQGGVAYYVCAPLPGEPLVELLRRGQVDEALARRVAQHCGDLLRAGFHLPDLSADHVFIAGDAPLAVLDLHNGTVTRPGTPPAQLCCRVLRRFARSVRQLPVPWPVALRFAVRLLRAAGRRDARVILRRLPPFTTAARYEAAGKAGAYATRNPARHARELALLERVFPGRPGDTVLDLPCGAGRLSPWLQQRGCAVVAADGALAMLQQARLARAVQADALLMPFADRAVDGVVTFRFLHHLPAELSDRVIAEACRVAARFVVVSFFHPCSAHHLQRQLRALTGGRTTRYARTLTAIERRFAQHGFRRLRHAADLPFLRDLWLASFVRGDLVVDTDPLGV